jgi:hypothetical protein
MARQAQHWIGLAAATVAALAGLLACGAHSQSPTNDISSSNTETVTDADTASPSIEGTGTEPPQSQTPKTVSISLAGLPVGGGSEISDTDQKVQCVQVNWLGTPSIAPGYTVQLTEFRFVAPDAFAIGEGACGARRPCLDPTVRLTSEDQSCLLIVRFTGSPVGDDPRVFVAAATVTCPGDQADECQQFSAKAASSAASISLQPPPDG